MKTYHAKPTEVQHDWYIVDADGKVLGRLASRLATVLRGKHKPIYSQHLDTGDFIVVINADKVKLTGRKELQKIFFRHTGYPGGDRYSTAGEVRQKHPERLIIHAVKGMLPRGPLGRQQLAKLKVYAGADHPHQAQKPQPLPL